MAVINNSNQYRYTGRGPYDAKSLVKDYATLLSKTTWTVDGTEDGNIIAYNGMITAVWLNKEDTTKKQIHIIGSIRTNYADFISSTYNLRKVAEMSEVAVCFRHIMTFVKTL